MKNIFTPAIGITLVALMATPAISATAVPSQAASSSVDL